MSDYFRIVRGLEIDETVRYLQGSGKPGTSADTNAANVGSVYTDNQTGDLYTKITPGSGLATWQQAGTGTGGGSALELYTEYAVTPTPPDAAGNNSVALGSGAHTAADASNSTAVGDQSLARLMGSVAIANGRFGSTGDAQTCKYLLRTHTINTTPTEMFLDGTGGSSRLILPDDTTWMYKVKIVGHRTDASDGHAGYTFEGVAYRMAGSATVSLLGSPIKQVLAESNAPWDAHVIADPSTGALQVHVVGQAGKTIRWLAVVDTVEITN